MPPLRCANSSAASVTWTCITGTLGTAAENLGVQLFAGRADRVLVWVPVGNPHLAAQGLDRHALDIGLDDVCLAHVVGESFVIAVIGGGVCSLISPSLRHGVHCGIAGADWPQRPQSDT